MNITDHLYRSWLDTRLPHEVIPRMRPCFDRAGALRWRHEQCGLPPTSTGSAPRSTRGLRHEAGRSRLDTRPASSSVNALYAYLPALVTRDSGPLWVASPATSRTFISITPPFFTGARRPT